VRAGQIYADLGDSERSRRAWVEAAELFASVGAEDGAAQVWKWIADLDR
jgi:hypothetical protein